MAVFTGIQKEGKGMRYIKNAKLVLENGILWDGVLAIIAGYGPERCGK